MKKNKVIIVALIIICLTLPGCSRHSSSRSYTLADQKNAAEEHAKSEIERIKTEKKEEFDKMYADEIYLEDFDEIEAEFIKSYSAHIENMLSRLDLPFTYELSIQFYNSSLKSAKEGNLSFENVLGNTGEHIRKIDLKISFFSENHEDLRKELKPIHKALKEFWAQNKESGVIENEVLWSVYDQSILNAIALKDIQSESNHLFLLDPYKACLSRNIFSKQGLDSYALRLDSTQEELDHLAEEAHKKYKEDFIGLIDLKGKGPSMCAPANDISLAFETDGEGKDKYITLLVQKAIYEEVDKILLEVGLDEVVVPIVVPTDRGIPEIIEQNVDYPQQLANEVIINDCFDSYTTITLYYLINDLEDIDYDKLQDFYLRFDPLFVVRRICPMPNGPDFKEKNLTCFVFYFKDSNFVVRNIYKEKIIPRPLTTKYFRGRTDLSNIASALYVTDDNSELSQVLKFYTEKEEQITDYVYIQGNDKKIEINEFIEHTTDDSIYAD